MVCDDELGIVVKCIGQGNFTEIVIHMLYIHTFDIALKVGHTHARTHTHNGRPNELNIIK